MYSSFVFSTCLFQRYVFSQEWHRDNLVPSYSRQQQANKVTSGKRMWWSSYRSERKLQPVIKQKAGSLSLFSSQARAAWRLGGSKLTLSPKGGGRATHILPHSEVAELGLFNLKLTSVCLISTGTLQNFAFLRWKTPMADTLISQSAQQTNRNVLFAPSNHSERVSLHSSMSL